MKLKSLWEISVATANEAEEAVVRMMADVFGQEPTAYCDFETGEATVTLYFERKPAFSQAQRAQLESALRRIKRCGLQVGRARIALAKVRRQDWAESWKRHFKPLEIGTALLVKPSWSRRPAKRGQATVTLDPGLSFGTGQHATTRFCLRQLVRCRRKPAAQSFLDIGTGSGILAIAAAKLGYAPVVALDFDPAAIAVARANALRNRVASKIQFYREDVTQGGARARARYTVIGANLLSSVLLRARKRILNSLQPGGVVVVAGVLKTEFAEIRKAYEAAGVRLANRGAEKEWSSASFRAGQARPAG